MAIFKSKEKDGLLATLKEVTFFVAIYLYFTGFIYVYYFYDHFGIPVRAVDTPVYYFFVYSYNVVWNFGEIKWAALLARPSVWFWLITLFVLSLIFSTFKRRRGVLTTVLLLPLFPLLSSLAYEAANIEARNLRLGITAKEITLVFKPTAEIKPPAKVLEPAPTGGGSGQPAALPEDTAESKSLQRLFNANKRIGLERSPTGNQLPKLYLLTETANSYYVLYQPRSNGDIFKGYVYEIPKSDVAFANIEIPEPKN